MTIKEIISRNIVNLRKEKGLTQIELADALHYSNKAISKWEKGDSLPDAETLYEIAKFFNVSIEYLFTNHDEVILNKEQANKIRKKEIIFYTSLVTIVCLLVYSVIALIFSIIPQLSRNNIITILLLYGAGVIAIILIIQICLKVKKYITLLLSLLIWDLTIGLNLLFWEYSINYIYIIAILLQIIVIITPIFYRYLILDIPILKKKDSDKQIENIEDKDDKTNN